MTDLVVMQAGKPVTSSVLVAQRFGKQHKHVLTAIRNILESTGDQPAENSARQMFLEGQYVDTKGENRPMIFMDRDGFALLVMGFTGKEALKFKLDFISAFNEMEAKIKQKPLTVAEMLFEQSRLMVEHERKLSEIGQKVDLILADKQKAESELQALPLSDAVVPELALRDKVRMMVNKLAHASHVNPQSIWDSIYNDLYYRFHVSIRSYPKRANESLLDVADRNGHTDKIYAIISEKLRIMGINKLTS
jgi:Rha family phage regulatory protein